MERPPQQIEIFDLRLFDVTETEFSLSVVCSAGTYIRSLADDIGKKLGCGAVLTSLRRTAANGFTLADCVTLEDLEALRDQNRVFEKLIPVETFLSSYEKLTVTEAQSVRFQNGGELARDRLSEGVTPGVYRVFSPDERFLGLGEIEPDGDSLQVRRVYVGD